LKVGMTTDSLISPALLRRLLRPVLIEQTAQLLRYLPIHLRKIRRAGILIEMRFVTRQFLEGDVEQILLARDMRHQKTTIEPKTGPAPRLPIGLH